MNGVLKRPLANNSPEAVKLRTLALEFGNQPENDDQHDRPGQRLNRALLKAALAYAKVAMRHEKAVNAAERIGNGHR